MSFPSEFVGTWDLKQGTITCNGVTRTIRDHRQFVEDSLRDEFWSVMDRRDLTSDIQALPGSKPYFYDDWYYDYPEQRQIENAYPWDLGYRSP